MSEQKTANLHQLFIDLLKYQFWVERKMVEVLPEIVDKAHFADLKQAIRDHLEVTKQHVENVNKVFEFIGEKSDVRTCKALSGIIEAGKEMLEMTAEETGVRDAAIIIAIQRVKHYEIASYGSLISLAEQLGEESTADLLKENLQEEKAADVGLSQVAEKKVNQNAEEA